MASRIKGLRQKLSDGSFDSLVPFGTDGALVDMLSGLDNEIEMKLGGNHTATIIESIEQNEPTTTVIEKYIDKNDLQNIYYSLKTVITEHADGSTTIVSAIYPGDYTEDDAILPLNTKTITIPSNGTANFTIGEVLS